MNKSTNKIKVEVDLFNEISMNEPFTWKSIKHIDLQDDDMIQMGWDEGFNYTDNSMDSHWYARITRKVEETDEQFEKRQSEIEIQEKWAKQLREKSYLKLKQEFENPSN
jgi:hypothetical protein